LPRPPSVNALFATDFKTRRRFETKEYSKWKAYAGQLVMLQHRPNICGPISIIYNFGKMPDKRRRDVMNYEKGVSDILVSMDIIEDDSFIQAAVIRWSGEIEPGMVKIEVYKCEEIVCATDKNRGKNRMGEIFDSQKNANREQPGILANGTGGVSDVY
jgi:Holliday junction resolvase RusA-like endonuclease